jgi:hypothetical protein
MWFLGTFGLLYRALTRPFGFLSISTLTAAYTRQQERPPYFVLTLDKAVGSLNLAMTSRSYIDIWVEEARIDLQDVETGGERYNPVQAVLKIRELVAPSETLHVSLINTVYNAAGRPQGVYSCIISTALLCRTDGASGEEFCQSVSPYRARMIALVPLSLQRIGRFDKLPTPGKSEVMSSFDRGEHGRRVRRSRRITAQSAVIVEGRFSDGDTFSASTHALVLSAHGCLVTLPKPLKIGESVVVRNVGTHQEQRCRVVHIRGTHDGDIQAGLGFETAAPEFWGLDCLPSLGTQ